MEPAIYLVWSLPIAVLLAALFFLRTRRADKHPPQLGTMALAMVPVMLTPSMLMLGYFHHVVPIVALSFAYQIAFAFLFWSKFSGHDRARCWPAHETIIVGSLTGLLAEISILILAGYRL